MTTENHRELLAEVSGRTKLQIREVLARCFPQADIPSSLKELPALEPLSPERYRLLITLSAEQKEKVELARDLLSHANPSGDLAMVLERAIDELISKLEKQRFGRLARTGNLRGQRTNTYSRGQVAAIENAETRGELANPGSERRDEQQVEPIEPDAQSTPLDPRPTEQVEQIGPRSILDRDRRRKHIANETRRHVLERDGCGCAFVGRNGQRCAARGFLQFHHQRAWAQGGRDSAENLQVLCQAHNRLLAERDFGRAHVERAIARAERGGKRRSG